MNYFTPVALAIMAAALNAVAALLQRRVVGDPLPDTLFRRTIITSAGTNRLWLLGLILQLGTGGLEAAALYSGSLVLVEPLLTTDLIFLLFFLRLVFKVPLHMHDWISVSVLCIGLSLLLATANPVTHNTDLKGYVFLVTVVILFTFTLFGIPVARRSLSKIVRIIIASLVAGTSFGVTAVLTKAVMLQLHHNGILAVFAGWQLYTLLLSAAVSLYALQSAYAAGPIALSQPIVEISDPLIGALVGVLVFGDTIRTTPPALALETIGAILIIVGVWGLGSSRSLTTSKI